MIEYKEIVEAFGHEILYWQVFGSLQGDFFVLLKELDLYGYLIIGYGSCTGCDALKGCVSDRDYLELADKLRNQIRWDTASGTLKWIVEDCLDWCLWEEGLSELFKEASQIIIKNFKLMDNSNLYDLIRVAVERSKNDKRTPEEIIEDGISFILGEGLPDELLDEEEIKYNKSK